MTFDRNRGRFAPCPNKPNCVCSQDSDQRHAIDPFPLTGSIDEGREQLVAILNAMPRSTIITVEDDYIHAEFRSRIFRFVDDVEFWLDAKNGVIHLRSAARSGYSDLGVNRARIEEIRSGYFQTQRDSK
ncbi:DUF1499 domain-containing protein [Chloroflexi bacterium TSY]|nr:DUF1499 domain-containing protein [Chloroflexi bacterium TSY]